MSKSNGLGTNLSYATDGQICVIISVYIHSKRKSTTVSMGSYPTEEMAIELRDKVKAMQNFPCRLSKLKIHFSKIDDVVKDFREKNGLVKLNRHK